MRTALRRMGNSAGMIVPKAILTELGSGIGEHFEISVEDGRIVAAPVRIGARAGWAEAATTIGREQNSADAAEQAELAALAPELKAAAERMAATLDEAIAALREANDPTRDEEFRRRALAELGGRPVFLDFSAFAAP